MQRIIQLIHIESGEIIDRARSTGFSAEYFSTVRQWREAHAASEYLIRFRPIVKLNIDLSNYQIQDETHGT